MLMQCDRVSRTAVRAATIGFLALLLARGFAQNATPSPAQQYQDLLKEYQTAASGTGTTDDDRRKSIARVDALRPSLSARFLDLAEKHPSDPVAVDALIQAIWMANGSSFPDGGPDSPGGRAMALILRDHITDERVGPICLRISTGFRREYEPFLRGILANNPHKSARGLVCLALGQYLNDRMQRVEHIRKQPKEYREFFGKAYVDELLRKDRRKTTAEVEALFVRARDEFGDEKIPYEGTVRAKASAQLFELHNLDVRKVAPDIEGQDQDGKTFHLSEYRGKVVLLDFWNKY